MTTLRQVERYWEARTYEKLFRELLAARPESAFRFEFEAGWAMPAAALAVIRLDELSQSHTPLYARLVRAVLAGQEPDGGWGDLVTTALCLRALTRGRGNGMAVERGLSYLANLQKNEGIWPAGPLRRMPADAYASGLVLYELGDCPAFREAVRFHEAVNWFEANEPWLGEETRRLWDRARLRCRLRLAAPALVDESELVALWA